jgi:nitrate/nitrite transporter NarK
MTSSKATQINLLDFKSAPMRAFQVTWITFFLCFFGWFGIAPLMPIVRADLGLTKGQIGNIIIASVAINNRAIGAVSGIVGAGGNVGAVIAGFLFKSETISYRESLFIIGIAVLIASVISLLLSLSKKTKEEFFAPEFQPTPYA